MKETLARLTNSGVAAAVIITVVLHLIGTALIPGYSSAFSIRAMLVLAALWQILSYIFPDFLFPPIPQIISRTIEILVTGSLLVDVLLTAVGQNRLFRNTGAGAFVDVTARAGLGSRRAFSTSAMWLDYDRDGWLDLLICNYVQWSPEGDIFCSADGREKSYCTPEAYRGSTSWLYRNKGDGTFEDVTARAGLFDSVNRAWDFAERGEKVPQPIQAQVMMSMNYGCQVAVDVTSTAHRLGGGSAAYADSSLLRRLRDVQTARQHVMFGRGARPLMAKALSGEDTFAPPFLV